MANSKNAFWQSLIITVAIFIIGIAVGMSIEGNRLEKITDYYAESEISLMDMLALNSMQGIAENSCSERMALDLAFADRIYEEARLLEQFEDAEKLADDFKLAHKRYDLLRTMLWANAIQTSEQCEGFGFNVVVYLYELESEDLTVKATQNVWSKILLDLKNRYGEKVVLIPIAADSDVASLDLLVAQHDPARYPAVIINGHVVTTLNSVEELEEFLELI